MFVPTLFDDGVCECGLVFDSPVHTNARGGVLVVETVGIMQMTQADDNDMRALAWKQAEWDAAHPKTRAMPNRTGDSFKNFYRGLRGEWPVADDLGRPRRRHWTGSDGGVDLIAPSGHTLAVRFRQPRDGWLMAFDNHRVKTAVMILVVDHGPLCVRIVGAISTDRFYAIATPIDKGWGPSHQVPQDALMQWVEARPWLRGEA